MAVFTSGTDRYHTFRIPTLLSLGDNQLLALADARLEGAPTPARATLSGGDLLATVVLRGANRRSLQLRVSDSEGPVLAPRGQRVAGTGSVLRREH